MKLLYRKYRNKDNRYNTITAVEIIAMLISGMRVITCEAK